MEASLVPIEDAIRTLLDWHAQATARSELMCREPEHLLLLVLPSLGFVVQAAGFSIKPPSDCATQKDLHVDLVKIDGEFFDRLGNRGSVQAILTSVIQANGMAQDAPLMAHSVWAAPSDKSSRVLALAAEFKSLDKVNQLRAQGLARINALTQSNQLNRSTPQVHPSAGPARRM